MAFANQNEIGYSLQIKSTVNEQISYQQLNNSTIKISTNSQNGYYLINNTHAKRTEGIVENNIKINPGQTSITTGL